MIRLFFLFSILILFSCNTHNHIPADVIKPADMQTIMWDMIRADNLAEERVRRDSFLNLNHENLKLVNEVFAIHKIKKSDFDRSLLFYQNNPDLLRVVLDSVKVQQARKMVKEKTVVPVVKPKSIFDSIPTGSSPVPRSE
jgi:hypothetical protein